FEITAGLWRPESRHPLPAAFGLAPVTGHPLAVRRRGAPDAADPEEVTLLLVPGPVAGKPLHIFIIRLLLRRNLLDWIRRSPPQHYGWLRTVAHRPREGVVNRSPCQHFDSIRLGVRRLTVPRLSAAECLGCQQPRQGKQSGENGP